MQTLYFPAMTSIYDRRPLTADEQAEMIAFFKQTNGHATSVQNTVAIIAMGITVLTMLLVITGLIWRDRLISVRGRLVARARRAGGAA